MASMICICTYPQFKLAVPKTQATSHCHDYYGQEFFITATVNGIEYLYRGDMPSTFDSDYPKSTEVTSITKNII